MVYADDIVLFGSDPHKLFAKFQEKVSLGHSGELKAGETVEFLGRRLKHIGDNIVLCSGKD